jgi:hypothetical protein
MLSKRLLAGLLGCGMAVAALAADPNTNVSIAVDGTAIDGVTGYRIDFSRQDMLRTDSRRLGVAYSPDQRLLTLTVTQKGLAQLQDWINQTTSGGTPTTHTVQVTAKDEKNQVLVRWELTNVVPTTLSSAAAGNFIDITATLEFFFDQLRLLEARNN